MSWGNFACDLTNGNSSFAIERLGACRKLKKLSLLGVGNIPSLGFLANCPDLENVAMHFSTKIEDGDLTALMNAPKLRHISFKRYKNYTHTLDDIKKHHKIPNVWMSLHQPDTA